MTPDKVSGQVSGTVRTDTPFLKGCPLSGMSAGKRKGNGASVTQGVEDIVTRILSGQSAALFVSGDRLFILASKQDLANMQAFLIEREKKHPLELVAEIRCEVIQ
jgi:hypothetical protein